MNSFKINLIYFFLLYSANYVTVTNQGSKTIYVGFFNDDDGDDNRPSFIPERRIRLSPRASQTVYLADKWDGHVQKLSGVASDPATWAEMNFDAFSQMTLCNISLVQGFNGAMQLTSQDGSFRAGFTNDLFAEAPDKFKTKDSRGNNVLQSIVDLKSEINIELVNYYQEKLAKVNVKLLPNDFQSLYESKDNRMNLAIY